MNKVILSGNLCQEIEVKVTTSGKEVTTNCIAVQRDYKNDKGEYESDFINIVVWGQAAQYLGRYAHKGDRAEVCGCWRVRKYTAPDGTTRTVSECVVDSIKVFSRQPKEETAPDINPKFEELKIDDDLPF